MEEQPGETTCFPKKLKGGSVRGNRRFPGMDSCSLCNKL